MKNRRQDCGEQCNTDLFLNRNRFRKGETPQRNWGVGENYSKLLKSNLTALEKSILVAKSHVHFLIY